MADIVDRLEAVNRTFPHTLVIGAGDLADMFTDQTGVGAVVAMDLAPARVGSAGAPVAGDEERLPFAPASFDLIVSLLTLHAANDLVGALAQARLALRPDGLFIAALFAEDTLALLRRCLYEAEAEITGGVSARVAPFARLQDFGQALARAGFALPVADVDKVSVRYREATKLLSDLRGMGETNVLKNAGRPLRRAVLIRALELFEAAGGEERAEIVYLTGWAPHESQQRPLKPGSAAMRLKDAIEGAE